MPERHQAFPSAPVSAGQARRFVQDALDDAGLGQFAYAATLLVSELVANAILHTATPFDVVVRPGADRVRIEVHDGSHELPVRRHYSNLSGTGRGLMLVEEVAAGWGADPTPKGKVVWFELESASAPAFDVMSVDAL